MKQLLLTTTPKPLYSVKDGKARSKNISNLETFYVMNRQKHEHTQSERESIKLFGSVHR